MQAQVAAAIMSRRHRECVTADYETTPERKKAPSDRGSLGIFNV